MTLLRTACSRLKAALLITDAWRICLDTRPLITPSIATSYATPIKTNAGRIKPASRH